MMILRTALLAAAVACLAAGQTPKRVKRTVTDAEVKSVHRAAILIDTHNDIPSRTVTGVDIGEPSTVNMTDLPRMKQGGMGAEFFSVFVSANYVEGNHSAKRTLDMIDTVKHDIIERYPNDFMYSTTVADVREAHRQHKIAALMGIEGGHAIEDDLRLLRVYFNEGIRYMTLTHFNSNNWADASGDPKQPNHGLSPFGKQVVLEMNRLGMMVDISHTADTTFWAALETSQAPIIASHSSCRAISNVPRNMTDEMIVALAKKGGVIQINFDCGYLNQAAADATAAQAAKMTPILADIRTRYADDAQGQRKAIADARRANADPRIHATIADVVKHINHVVDLGGIGAVGLGSDFDGVACVPEDLNGVDKWPNLTRALLEEGYSRDDILKILGENTLRVMAQVEKVAASQRGNKK